MRFLIGLAVKNLKRRKRRTMFTVAGIAMGVWLTLTFFGVTNYNYAKLIENGSKMSYGHLSFLNEDYLLHSSAKNSVFVSEKELASSSKIGGIQKALPRIMISASAMSAKKSLPVAIMGIDVKLENSEDNVFLDHITSGEIPKSNSDRSVIVGKKLLEKLGLREGQKLIIQFSDKNGDIQSELLWITTVFSTGSEIIDTGSIIVPINILQKYLRYEENEYSFIAMIMNNPNLLEAAETDVKKIFASNNSGEVVDWKTSQESLYSLIKLDKSSGLFFICILGFIVALGNLNTILMSVLERRKEFGMMMAIGMKTRQLIMNVIYEAIVMSLLGVFIGFILGSLTYSYFLYVGLDISEMVGGAEAANSLFDPIMRSKLYLKDYFISAISFIILTILASLYPALKIRKLNPIEVMTR